MDPITNMVLTVLLATSTSFGDGVKAFKEGKTEDAIKQFSAVIETKDQPNILLSYAYLMRGYSYLKANQPDKTKEDSRSVIEHTDDVELIQSAYTLYSLAKGNTEDLAPKESPKDVLQAIVDAIKEADYEKAQSMSIGQFKSAVTPTLKGGYNAILNSFSGAYAAKQYISTNPSTQKAWVVMETGRQNRYRNSVEFVRSSNRWMAASTLQGEFDYEKMMAQRIAPSSKSNADKLNLILLSLFEYRKRMNSYPEKLEDLSRTSTNDLVKMLPDEVVLAPENLLWTDPETKTNMPFLYAIDFDSRFKDSNEISTRSGRINMANMQMNARVMIMNNMVVGGSGFSDDQRNCEYLVIAPNASGGKRDVLKTDGTVESVDEKEFSKYAIQNKLKLDPLFSNAVSEKNVQKDVEDLISRLQDPNPKTRKEAREKIKALDDNAIPILIKYRNHADPEVAETIKDILKDKK